MPNTAVSTAATHPLAVSGQAAATGLPSEQSTTENGRQLDENGRPVLPWAFIDCDTEDLVVLIGE